MKNQVIEQVKEALIKKHGYWNAVNLTNGFDLIEQDGFAYVRSSEMGWWIDDLLGHDMEV